MSYERSVTVDLPFEQAVERVRDVLADQGFGVLTEIDVQETLRIKRGIEMEPYVILGACNPDLAHRALEVDRGIGTLLPCNVVVAAAGEGSQVRVFDPLLMAQVTGREEIAPIAAEAEQRLSAALAALPQIDHCAPQ
ncbi:MAG: DUF302 domain-containing protein [Actinomycetota bacterium]|nr:DUF302 domain-containing protein [Actinomycetota bacterium]